MSSLSNSQVSEHSQDQRFLTEPQRRPSPKYESVYSEPGFESDETKKETAKQFARLAARLNASAVTDRERSQLLAERTELLKKRLVGAITKKEEVRLEYVRWSLDRIEDAKHGTALDRLDSEVEQIRKLADEIANLNANLSQLGDRRR